MAEYGVPAGACNHFADLFSCLIVNLPNSFVTRLIQILWRSLATDSNLPVIESCKSGPFSLLIDEYIDKRDDKQLVLSFEVLRSREQQLVYADL